MYSFFLLIMVPASYASADQKVLARASVDSINIENKVNTTTQKYLNFGFRQFWTWQVKLGIQSPWN